MACPDVPSLVKHLCGAWGGALALGWGYSCQKIPCRYSALFIRACSNNCMAFSFCLFEGEEIEKRVLLCSSGWF